jgi:hypothetical protein
MPPTATHTNFVCVDATNAYMDIWQRIIVLLKGGPVVVSTILHTIYTVMISFKMSCKVGPEHVLVGTCDRYSSWILSRTREIALVV